MAGPQDRPGPEVAKDLVGLVDEVITASGTSGWSRDDGTAWSRSDIGQLRGQVCTNLADKFTLEVVLLGPASEDPGAASDGMRKVLEDKGFVITNDFTPKAGEGSDHAVAGQRPDGARVDFRSGPGGSSLGVESECSNQITLNAVVTPGS